MGCIWERKKLTKTQPVNSAAMQVILLIVRKAGVKFKGPGALPRNADIPESPQGPWEVEVGDGEFPRPVSAPTH